MEMASPIRIRETVIWRTLRDCTIVLDVGQGRYFQLQNSAREIWQAIDSGAGSVSELVQGIRGLHGAAPSVEADIVAFVESALDNRLLESEAIGARANRPEPDTLQIRRSALVRGDLVRLRSDFERQHYVRLPQLLEPSLLNQIADRIEAGEFFDRTHEGIGTELCLVPGLATSALQLLFNDPDLLDAVSAIAGSDRVRFFDGRVYKLAPSAGHYDSWHSDAAEDRVVAVSVNFGREPFDGGVLEIRKASAPEPIEQVPNPGFGDAVMFRISPALRHRVSAVQGRTPRTAYAGWFRTSPDFQDLFFATLPKD
jgi:hypothetical protein